MLLHDASVRGAVCENGTQTVSVREDPHSPVAASSIIVALYSSI